jgi:hypothetical protein
MRLIAILFVVSVTGCSDTTPARIALSGDTVIVNTTTVAPLDVHVVNRKGVVLPQIPVRYSMTDPDSTAVTQGNGIQCRNDGVARVSLSAGRLASSVMVRCHIIEKIVAEGLVCTRLGDPPVRLSATAFDRDGNEISAPRMDIITDSSFVRIANGLIIPLRAGDGDIDYTNGRRRGVTLLRVLDTAAVVDSVRSHSIKARDEMFEPVCRKLLRG